MIIILINCLLISLESYSVFVNAACTWPSDFVDSIWTDSLKGDLNFTSTTMTGWPVKRSIGYKHINNWECVTYNTSGPFLVMKSIRSLELNSSQFTGYRCLMLEKITNFSYRYYQMEPVQKELRYARLNILKDSSLNDTNVLCTLQPATGSEFQMMLRKGYEDATAVTCPCSLLADYDFTYQSSDGTVSCDVVSDVGYVEMCSNVTQFNVPNFTCSSYPFYTSEDAVWCVDVVVVGTDTFVSLYNGLQEASSIDERNTYHFSCVSINVEGTSMSVTPQHCKANQSSTEVPTDNAGSEIGAVLSLSIDRDTWLPCPLLRNPARGNVVKSTKGAVTKATYSCEGNYSLSGNDTRICQADGTWSGSEPSCTCPITTPFPHGSVTLTTDGLSLSFTCDAGYVLVGESTLNCNTETNTWSNTNPTCVGCAALENPLNGNVTLSTNGTLTKATFTCDVGFSLKGEVTSQCQTDGTWSTAAPSCSCPITTPFPRYMHSFFCNAPFPPGNGTMTLSNDVSEAVYTCRLGFSIQGPSTRNCQSDGSGWSNMDPVCVGCAALENPLNGTVTLSTNGTLTKATFTCDVGFSLKGEVTSQCQTDGTWSAAAPSCSQCDNVPSVSSGSFALTSDGTITSAEYSCKVGTTISGDVIVSCDVNGDWSITSTNTSCVECPALSETGGSYTLSSNGTTTTATLTCASGYVLVGSETVECQNNGSWTSSTTQSKCVSTSKPAESSSSGNTLLNGVIVVAVLTLGFAAALGGSLFYIQKLKKNTIRVYFLK